MRVELACGNEHLIAQIVPESVREMGIKEGTTVVAAIKASVITSYSIHYTKLYDFVIGLC